MRVEASQAPLAILRVQEVCRRTGVSRATIYRLMSRGEFPKGHSLSKGTVGWNEAEVQGWIARKLGVGDPA